MKLKKIAAAALISLPAVAADKDSKAMASFLREVAYSKNLAKYDDAKVSLDGFVFMVEPMQDQPGYYIAQLSDSNSGVAIGQYILHASKIGELGADVGGRESGRIGGPGLVAGIDAKAELHHIGHGVHIQLGAGLTIRPRRADIIYS